MRVHGYHPVKNPRFVHVENVCRLVLCHGVTNDRRPFSNGNGIDTVCLSACTGILQVQTLGENMNPSIGHHEAFMFSGYSICRSLLLEVITSSIGEVLDCRSRLRQPYGPPVLDLC